MNLVTPAGQYFYHGTAPENVARIWQVGFRIKIYVEEDGSRWPTGGCLDTGVYITKNWQMALCFGRALLRVELRRGTRILDLSPKPDEKVLNTLRKEFGARLLAMDAPIRKLIPANKHLTVHELVELTRYHYHRTWEQHKHHGVAFDNCVRMLRKYKFDGYGHPENDIGILILDPSRVRLKQLIAVVPERRTLQSIRQEFSTPEELAASFARKGEPTYQQLAEQIAGNVASQSPRSIASVPSKS
jgi:hypothetical protein